MKYFLTSILVSLLLNTPVFSQKLIWESSQKSWSIFSAISDDCNYLVTRANVNNSGFDVMKMNGVGDFIYNKRVENSKNFKESLSSRSDWVFHNNVVIKLDTKTGSGLLSSIVKDFHITVIDEQGVTDFEFLNTTFDDIYYYYTNGKNLFIMSTPKQIQKLHEEDFYKASYNLFRINLKSGELKKMPLIFPEGDVEHSSFWMPLRVEDEYIEFYRLVRTMSEIKYEFIYIDENAKIIKSTETILPFSKGYPLKQSMPIKFHEVYYAGVRVFGNPEIMNDMNFYEWVSPEGLYSYSLANIANLYYCRSLDCYFTYGAIGEKNNPKFNSKDESKAHGLYYAILDKGKQIKKFGEFPNIPAVEKKASSLELSGFVSKDYEVVLSFSDLKNKTYTATLNTDKTGLFKLGPNPATQTPFMLSGVLFYDVKLFEKIARSIEPNEVKYDGNRGKTMNVVHATNKGMFFFKCANYNIKAYFVPN